MIASVQGRVQIIWCGKMFDSWELCEGVATNLTTPGWEGNIIRILLDAENVVTRKGAEKLNISKIAQRKTYKPNLNKIF